MVSNTKQKILVQPGTAVKMNISSKMNLISKDDFI